MEKINQELERRRKQLVKQIQQGEKINNLTAAPEWEFFEQWLNESRDVMIRDMTSDSFVDDHNGYLYTLGVVRTIDMINEGVKAFKASYDRAIKKIDELDNLTNG
jgi:hypothetical protein